MAEGVLVGTTAAHSSCVHNGVRKLYKTVGAGCSRRMCERDAQELIRCAFSDTSEYGIVKEDLWGWSWLPC